MTCREAWPSRLLHFAASVCPVANQRTDRLIADPKLTILEGALAPWGDVSERGEWFHSRLRSLARRYKFRLSTPWNKLPKRIRNIILNGTDEEIRIRYVSGDNQWTWDSKFEGVIPHLERIHKQTDSDQRREWVERFLSILSCHKGVND